MFGLGHLPMAEPYYSFGSVSLTANHLPLYAGWWLCVHTGKCREASGEGQQSSGEFCMLGAHTEPSRWINKGVLASDCANFLTFGIINDFSLPLEKKKPAVPVFFWDTSKAFSTTNKLIIWQAKCPEKWKQISLSKSLNILAILYLVFKCCFLFV